MAPPRLPRMTITCEKCGICFESKQSDRRFCSLNCYVSSDFCRMNLQRNSKTLSEANRLAQGIPLDDVLWLTCLNCELRQQVSMKHYNRKKFCNSICYRQYQAKRFDRYIANPESVALPQNYDEFLTKDILPCLVEGCSWTGENLSGHANLAHGIPAKQFKQMAGFNQSSGLIVPELWKQFSKRQKAYADKAGLDAAYMDSIRRYAKPRMPRSLEAKEHGRKGSELRRRAAPLRTLTCCGCQNSFQTTAHIKKYCSVECREKFYKHCHDTTKFSLRCDICKSQFEGNIEQKRRHDKGMVIACSGSCKMHRAGKISKGTWLET